MADHYVQFAFNFVRIALHAARPVLDIYQNTIQTQTKADGSPVTDADLAADRIIRDGLNAAWPNIPVISEEDSEPSHARLERYFLVDPLDGTREFIDRNGAFTINIALIEHGESVAGCIYAPALGSLFIGGEACFGLEAVAPDHEISLSKLKPMSIRTSKPEDLTALASHSHGDVTTNDFLDITSTKNIKRIGSSLKFCMIAKGEADFYPRFGPTMGWDIAAGDAILKAAGGIVLTETGTVMTYDPAFMRNGPFIAIGDPSLVPSMRSEFIRAAQGQRHAKSGSVAPKSS